jgi:acyl carrier protein
MSEAARRTDGAAVTALVAELRTYLAGISDGKLRAEEIEPAGHLFDAGYVDSLTAVMLVAHLEEAYGVRIEDMDLVERLTTLDALASHVAAER